MIMLGVGCVIGTGIFVLTGVAAARYAGPGIVISFILAGFACLFTALAYSELASMVPVAGTVYAYSYVSLGEIAAWITGWSMILEYSVGAGVVAAGWSGYATGILKEIGITLPHALTAIPTEGGIMNLPAILIVGMLSLLLVRGTRESSTLNKVLVIIKLTVISIFIVMALPFVDISNWTPLLPFGLLGVAQGAAVIFFAYTGFDAVATAAEECHNPRRDLPIGIMVSLAVCTILYIVVAAVLTGVVNYQSLDTAAPVTFALHTLGNPLGAAIVGIGAIAGITTVLLVLMYGQSRILYSMSRDGLIPSSICNIHKSYGTPYKVTILVGLFVAMVAGFMPLSDMAELANIGVLFPFIVAATAAMILRLTNPGTERPFRCPYLFVVAELAIFSCGILMFSLNMGTWLKFIGWITLGMIIYFAYGYRHSSMRKYTRSEDEA
jgi:APA family basic amino acid/polyamine antiporter